METGNREEWLGELKIQRYGTEVEAAKTCQAAGLRLTGLHVLSAHARALPAWRRVFVDLASAERRVLAGP